MTALVIVGELVVAVAAVWATAAILAWPASPARVVAGWQIPLLKFAPLSAPAVEAATPPTPETGALVPGAGLSTRGRA